MMPLLFSGDLGDVISGTLAVARNLHAVTGEKVNLLACDLERLSRLFLPRLPLLIKLIEAQSYIGSLGIHKGEPCIDLANFRHFHSRIKPLPYGQTRAFNAQSEVQIPLDLSPWLDCEESSYSHGRIIIARSHRYRNELFNWKAFINRFRDDCLFLGSADEHKDMQARFGWVEWARTSDLYEAAQLIKSSRAVVANQSSILNIALGLGQKVVAELNTFVSDVVIDRENATYCYDGHFDFEGIHFEPAFPKDDSFRDLVCQRAILNSALKF